MVNPLFSGLTTEELSAVRNCISPQRKSYASGELIALRGDPVDSIGIIVSGAVTISKDFYSGNSVVVLVLQEGECFGEAAAVSTRSFYPVTVIAKTNCVVDFYGIQPILMQCDMPCGAHKIVTHNLLRMISDRLVQLQRRMDVISQKTLRGKIAAFVLDLYTNGRKRELMLPMLRYEWASFLGVSRPSLSRELAWMRDEGIIDFRGREITIRDLGALELCLDSLE